MDSDHDGDMSPDVELGGKIAAALNEQVIPQLGLLAHGPLQEGVAQALQLALQQGQSITATVLQLRVMVDGRLCHVVVQAAVTPSPARQ